MNLKIFDDGKSDIVDVARALCVIQWPESLVDGFARALAACNIIFRKLRPDGNVVHGLTLTHGELPVRGSVTHFDRFDVGHPAPDTVVVGEALLEVLLTQHHKHEPLPEYMRLPHAHTPKSVGGYDYDPHLVVAMAQDGCHHEGEDTIMVGTEIFVFATLAHEMQAEGFVVRVAINPDPEERNATMYIQGDGYDALVILDLLKVADLVQSGGRAGATLN